MELRHLRYFVAVAEELSFTRAAERLYTSQPSLSEQIRNLEQDVGFLLLRRTRRKVELTEVGEFFLHEARLVLRQADDALARTRKMAMQAQEGLTIGFVPAAEVRIFPAVLSEFRLRYPKVNVVLRSMIPREQEEALARGEIDVGFTRPPLRAVRLHQEVVLTEPIRVFLDAKHPLAALTRIPPHRLNKLPLVNTDRDYSRALHDITEQYLRKHRVKPDSVLVSSNILTSMNLIAGSFGYGLLPAYADAFSQKTVVSRPLIGANPTIDMLMVTTKEAASAREGALHDLMQLVRNFVSAGGRKP